MYSRRICWFKVNYWQLFSTFWSIVAFCNGHHLLYKEASLIRQFNIHFYVGIRIYIYIKNTVNYYSVLETGVLFYEIQEVSSQGKLTRLIVPGMPLQFIVGALNLVIWLLPSRYESYYWRFCNILFIWYLSLFFGITTGTVNLIWFSWTSNTNYLTKSPIKRYVTTLYFQTIHR